MDFESLEKKLKEATMDPKAAIETAAELAINHWGKAHEKADDLRVKVAKEKIRLLEEIKKENKPISMAEAKARVEATDLFREYLRAEHQVERIEEFIKVAKKHADISRI